MIQMFSNLSYFSTNLDIVLMTHLCKNVVLVLDQTSFDPNFFQHKILFRLNIEIETKIALKSFLPGTMAASAHNSDDVFLAF